MQSSLLEFKKYKKKAQTKKSGLTSIRNTSATADSDSKVEMRGNVLLTSLKRHTHFTVRPDDDRGTHKFGIIRLTLADNLVTPRNQPAVGRPDTSFRPK